MSLSNVELVMPDPNTFDIRINDVQRAVIMKCLYHTLHTMPNGMWKSADEKAIALSLHDMLHPCGSTGPLSPTGINSFVL